MYVSDIIISCKFRSYNLILYLSVRLKFNTDNGNSSSEIAGCADFLC